jgi:exodeoxyribonuclease V gamma subunit
VRARLVRHRRPAGRDAPPTPAGAPRPARRTRRRALHLDTQPLLAAWGKQGRDYIGLLEDYDRPDSYRQRFGEIGRRIDLFERSPADTLLRQLQDDILDLRPLPETQAAWPEVDPDRDASIAFHVVHSPQREVEVLHDQLLAAFAADDTLRPRDVIVMVPDVSAYAPHIRAVFGLTDAGDSRHIPFNVADQGQRQQDPLLGALERLLNLPRERIAVSEVLDLLDVPALRARFGIAEDDLPLLRGWMEAARIRWGLHAQHRASLGLPEGLEQNSWRFGLRRMLLGYAAGQGEAWNGIEPLAEVGGLDAALLGPLVRLVETLEAHWQTLDQPAPPALWVARLQQMLDDFFAAAEGSTDGLTLLRAQSVLDDWQLACEEAQLAQPLPLSVVRAHWLQSLEPPGLRQPFFAGGVTFASLMPMRAIPFPPHRAARDERRRLSALASAHGLRPDGAGAPPRRPLAARGRPLPVPRSAAVGARAPARQLGRPQHPRQRGAPALGAGRPAARPPRGRLAPEGCEGRGQGRAGAGRCAHRAASPAAFPSAYFDGSDPRLFSYADEWAAGGQAPTAAGAALDPPQAQPRLTLSVLGRFVRNPVRAFFEHRLAVRLSDEDAAAQDQEPFGLDGLENWSLQDELIRVQRAAVDAGAAREVCAASAAGALRRPRRVAARRLRAPGRGGARRTHGTAVRQVHAAAARLAARAAGRAARVRAGGHAAAAVRGLAVRPARECRRRPLPPRAGEQRTGQGAPLALRAPVAAVGGARGRPPAGAAAHDAGGEQGRRRHAGAAGAAGGPRVVERPAAGVARRHVPAAALLRGSRRRLAAPRRARERRTRAGQAREERARARSRMRPTTPSWRAPSPTSTPSSAPTSSTGRARCCSRCAPTSARRPRGDGRMTPALLDRCAFPCGAVR